MKTLTAEEMQDMLRDWRDCKFFNEGATEREAAAYETIRKLITEFHTHD